MPAESYKSAKVISTGCEKYNITNQINISLFKLDKELQ